ncbi:MAG: dTDP-4-dehydrorhamnose reductase [Candidatus Omnitrophica bacterium]|nr:dTDP-4-dehydrorhamnose reductase [Candidatus Omnitrophota bacterium]
MNVVVIGANGQLGTDFCDVYEQQGCKVFAATHDDLDITKVDSIEKYCENLKIDLLINTAASVDVDFCEEHSDLAYQVNAVGVKNLADFCQQRKTPLVHISTDYVFDGQKQSPYIEDDTPNPLNVYGKTKLAGEQFVQQILEEHYIFRTSVLYGRHKCRGKSHPNFVELLIQLSKKKKELKVVVDEILTPTPTKDLAQQIFHVTASQSYGLFHATPEGFCSRYKFAEELFKRMGQDIDLLEAKSEDFKKQAFRPHYSVLENSHLKKKKLNLFKSWQESLQNYLQTNYGTES